MKNPKILINSNNKNDESKLQTKFGFSGEVKIGFERLSQSHAVVRVSEEGTGKVFIVEINKKLNGKYKRVRGVTGKRYQSYISTRDIVNGNVVHEKGTSSGGPKIDVGIVL